MVPNPVYLKPPVVSRVASLTSVYSVTSCANPESQHRETPGRKTVEGSCVRVHGGTENRKTGGSLGKEGVNLPCTRVHDPPGPSSVGSGPYSHGDVQTSTKPSPFGTWVGLGP